MAFSALGVGATKHFQAHTRLIIHGSGDWCCMYFRDMRAHRVIARCFFVENVLLDESVN